MLVKNIVSDYDKVAPNGKLIATWALLSNVLYLVEATMVETGWEVTPIRKAEPDEPRERGRVMTYLQKRALEPKETRRVVTPNFVVYQGVSIPFYEWYESIKDKPSEPKVVILSSQE